jgi:hypothetical protein
MDGLQEIKDYFNKQNDWSTTTELEYFKWLIEEVEHLQFENDLIRRNRTTQERKDFNRIKQLEGEIQTLKSLAKINSEGYREQTERLQALRTANDLLHMENQEYEKALINIIKTEERLGIVTVSDIAKEALGEASVEDLNSQNQND